MNAKLIIILLLLSPIFAVGQNLEKQIKEKQIDEFVKDCYKKQIFNGSILIAEGNQVIYSGHFGYAEMENKTEINDDSRFMIASVSKQFTAATIMILSEKGKLSYDDPVKKYLPELSNIFNDITIRNLLTHTSGIKSYQRFEEYKNSFTNQQIFELINSLNHLNFQPGDRFEYSNSNYHLLSIIVEKVSGKSYSSFLQENILDPINMDKTFLYTNLYQEVPNRAHGYNSTGQLSNYERISTGAGGMYSTTSDLFKWSQAFYNGKLLQKVTKEEAFKPFILNSGEVSNYGFGVFLESNYNQDFVHHSGHINGYRAYLEYSPCNNLTIIMLTNYGDRFQEKAVINQLRRITNGKRYKPLKPRLSLLLLDLYIEDGIDKAIAEYRKYANDFPGAYENYEMELNMLGYLLINLDKLEDAITILRLNAEEHPSSANVYDSLGEAYYLLENYEQALKYYTKSIEIDPSNSNAQKIITEINSK